MKIILEDDTNEEQFEVNFTDNEIIEIIESYAYDKLFELLKSDDRLSNISIIGIKYDN